MKLFDKKIDIYAPTSGNIKKIEDVNDEIFSARLMGNGFAIEPTSNKIYSPVKGKITSIFPSKHAISIQTKSKQDILIHIGLETVELNGEGFDIKVTEGESVDYKTELISVDFDFIKKSNKETDVIVVLLESEDKILNINYGLTNEMVTIGYLK